MHMSQGKKQHCIFCVNWRELSAVCLHNLILEVLKWHSASEPAPFRRGWEGGVAGGVEEWMDWEGQPQTAWVKKKDQAQHTLWLGSTTWCCLRKHIPALILMWDFNLSPGREIQLCRRTTIFRSGYETKQSSSITGAGAHSMDKPITGIRTRGSLGWVPDLKEHWQRAKSGPWISEEWTCSCLKNGWMRSVLLRASRADQSWPHFRSTFLRSTPSWCIKNPARPARNSWYFTKGTKKYVGKYRPHFCEDYEVHPYGSSIRHVQDKEINQKGTAVIKKSLLEKTCSSSLKGSFCPPEPSLQISAFWGGCSTAGPCLQAILFEFSMASINIPNHYPWINGQASFIP